MPQRLLLAVLLPFAILGALRAANRAENRPNIVLILADDLGWADLPSYGNRFNETPNLDRLVREGMRFTQFYSGPVCSPTRANIQSGQDQARFGITQHIPGQRRPYAKLTDPRVPQFLPLDVETFAERLGAAGYATGYFGKWHLGGGDHGPRQQGWQTAIDFNGNTVPARLVGEGIERRGTDYIAAKAEAFIAAHRDRPFVLQLAPFAVHIRLSTTPALLAKYQAKAPVPGYPSRPDYAGLLEELDQCVGRVVAAIDAAGLKERTLILFASDNGGLETQQDGVIVTSNAPLRNEKGSLYEGGIRTPLIARWPGQVPAGTLNHTPLTTLDFYPTFHEIADVPLPTSQPVDGLSLAAVLRDPVAPVDRDTLTWHLPHYHHSTPSSAIRRGDWKLIEFFEDNTVELYHLGRDLGETTNLAEREPALVADLRAELAAWRDRVDARMPVPNPNHDPARASHRAKPEHDVPYVP
jgi:uncharacterized sulfatase